MSPSIDLDERLREQEALLEIGGLALGLASEGSYGPHPVVPFVPSGLELLVLVDEGIVVAVTVNHEGLEPAEVGAVCRDLSAQTGLPTCDPVLDGVGPVVDALIARLEAAAHG